MVWGDSTWCEVIQQDVKWFNKMWSDSTRKIYGNLSSWEICCACARLPLKLENFPKVKEITRCLWLLYICECLFNLYNFFAWDKDGVKCTLHFQCIEYLVWTAIEYYNLDTNKKTFDNAKSAEVKPIVASLTALSNAKQVQIWVQTERSSMLIRLTYILY
jgi:hypothetical protein